MKPIIKVENLSKKYRLGVRRKSQYGTLREAVGKAFQEPLRRLRRNGREADDTLWALKDVSFEVRPGEVVGLIGRNGAGKSTLLKVLSRITEPTSGRVELFGRVGSLLEIGTGFHPELSGRENIYLNGAVLGMRRAEIEAKFDEIIAFAEIEKFLDTPVKRYSSGMYMRLAFAVAAHLDPEILLVDEVLAVGDAAFQKKCLGKMGDVASKGRTVLFVSHTMAAVQSLCNRVIWFEDGKILEEAEPGKVILNYLKRSSVVCAEKVWDDMATAPGNDKVRLRGARVRPLSGPPSAPINVQTPLALEFEYWNLIPDAHINLSVVLYNEQGVAVFNTFPTQEPARGEEPIPAGLFRSTCRIPGNLLNDGMHRIHLYVVKDRGTVLFNLEDTLVFDVQDAGELRGEWYGKWIGAVRPILDWQTERLDSEEHAQAS